MTNICIDLLNNFTKKELVEFKRYVAPGVFNTDNKIFTLYNSLIKHVIGDTFFNNLLEVRIYNIVFNKKFKVEKLTTPQKKQLNALMSTLTRFAEDYLLYKLLQNNATVKQETLYKALLEKEQFKLLQKHLKNDKKKLEKVVKKEATHYRFSYQLEQYNFQVTHQTGFLLKQDNLEIINKNLDVSYILEKLSLWISILSLEQVTQRKFDQSSFEIIENYIKNTIYNKNPTIIVCISMINLLKHKTESTYSNLLKSLNKYENFVTNSILIGGYNIATNFCSYNIKRGFFTHQHIFELFKILDEKNILIEDGFMPATKLKNLVAIACRIEHFAWAESMLKKYISQVNKQFRNSVAEFNYGVIKFYKKDYNAALQHFIRVDDVNLVYNNNYRIMMMKAHYEVDKTYDERTVQIFRSAEKYFIANKLVSVNNRTAYKNFVRMLLNLYRIKHKATKMKTNSFIEKLNNQKLNNDKNWLLLKLEEIRT